MNTVNAVSIDILRELITPSLRQSHVDLVEVQWGAGAGGLLRVVIDKPAGVTLDDCERVSMAVGAVLDAYDPIASRYRLEVTSPGAERPLKAPEDWLNAVGRRVRVRYRDGEADTILEGRLLSASTHDLEIEVRQRSKSATHHVAMDKVISGRIAVDI